MPASLLHLEANQDRFLLEFYHMLFRMMPRRVRLEDREDVVHDIVTRCLVRMRRGRWSRSPDNLEAFAVISLRNEIINRRRKRVCRDEYDAEHFRDRSASHPEWMPADRSGDEASTVAFQQRVISRLPTRCQQAFYMVRQDNATYDDVAVSLDVSRHTVHNYITTAHRALREALRELGNPVPQTGRGGRPARARHAWKKTRLAPDYPSPDRGPCHGPAVSCACAPST